MPHKRFFLDADTRPPIRSHYSHCGFEKAKKRAFSMLDRVDRGKVGIYGDAAHHGFRGYAIKENGRRYFLVPDRVWTNVTGGTPC